MLLNSYSGDPKDSEPKTGSWLWNELWTDNIPKAYDFYQKIAGYTITSLGSEYAVAIQQKKWRAGIRPLPIDTMKSRWIPIIRVDDIAAASKRIESSGGQKLLEIQQPDSDARVVLAADPNGALFMIQNWSDSPSIEQE